MHPLEPDRLSKSCLNYHVHCISQDYNNPFIKILYGHFKLFPISVHVELVNVCRQFHHSSRSPFRMRESYLCKRSMIIAILFFTTAVVIFFQCNGRIDCKKNWFECLNSHFSRYYCLICRFTSFRLSLSRSR